ncbi:MAG: 2-iminobutanoate/2-iminopropanoate deaminase [Planctomycetota bacterium]|jgi:2-iminobutanoate/2-iminopropanoate deaminase
MSDRQVVSTPNAPAAIGPYSQAVTHGGLLYSSGQIALDPSSMELIEGGVVEQTRQVLNNLRNVLEAAGSGMGHVIKTTVYLKDMGEFAVMNEVYGTYFPEDAPPARATVEVARLPKDVRVEIDCIAVVPE